MKLMLIVVTAVFSGFSGWAIWQVGYFGIWAGALQNPGSQQVLADLVVACLLICSWIVQDARAHGRNPWPFVILTLTAGSFGPLFYLLFRRSPGRQSAEA